MSRLHTSWSRSLLRDKPSKSTAKQEQGKKVLVTVGGAGLLSSFHMAKRKKFIIEGLKYLYNENKDGHRILQRFYIAGGKATVPGEDFERDAVIEVEPRFPDGHILPLKKNHMGTLVVEAPDTTNVIGIEYLQPESPDTSSVKLRFLITPDFVSFDGVKSVDPNAKTEKDESEEDESEEG